MTQALFAIVLLATAGQAPAQGPLQLEGTAWTAIELYGATVASLGAEAGREPHLVFGAQGRLSGSDGCNRLSGPYTEKGAALTFGNMAATMMACPGTDALVKQFRAALTGTAHWSIVRDRLEFYGATGKPLAVFTRRPAAAPAASGPLEGTTWQLVRFRGGDDRVLTPGDSARYSIAFLAGGRLAAQVDCNRGRSTWKTTPPAGLELGPLALTRAKCPEGSLHDHIVKQWTYLRSYLIKDGHLFLSLMADGGTYEFAPAPPPVPGR